MADCCLFYVDLGIKIGKLSRPGVCLQLCLTNAGEPLPLNHCQESYSLQMFIIILFTNMHPQAILHINSN